MGEVRNVLVLGSTGSVGSCALKVIGSMPDRFRASALVARASVGAMLDQAARFKPDTVMLTDPAAAGSFAREAKLEGLRCKVLAGEDDLDGLVRDGSIDDVIVASSGILGLGPTLAALEAGKRVLTANKESVVAGGALLRRAVREHDGRLLPIDSEHNALFQLMGLERTFGPFPDGVRRIVLTASGGPFRGRPLEELAKVHPRQAISHPVWKMGSKISVDSATLMNKGLEVIEAHWLFGADPDRIDVVVHPECVIHGIVELEDGNSLAHMGVPDMALPIRSALAHPGRAPGAVAAPGWGSLGTLRFEPPDRTAFPCLGMAFEALRMGGAAPAVLNTANEVAVEAFLDGRIGFLGIPEVVEKMLQRCDHKVGNLEELLEAHEAARIEARRLARL